MGRLLVGPLDLCYWGVSQAGDVGQKVAREKVASGEVSIQDERRTRKISLRCRTFTNAEGFFGPLICLDFSVST